MRTDAAFGLPVQEIPSLPTATDGGFVVPQAVGDPFIVFATTANAASDLRHCRGPSGPLELRLQPAVARPFQLDGLDPWRAEGPLRAFVLLPTAVAWGAPLPLDGRGKGVLPALPQGDVELELRTQRDDVLWRQRIPRGMPAIRMHLPPPEIVSLRVVDTDGEPLAAIRVEHEWETADDTRAAPLAVAPQWHHRQLGATGKDGRVSVRLPRATKAGAADRFAFPGGIICHPASGPPARTAWWPASGIEGDGRLDGDEIEVVMPAAAPFAVSLTRGGKPFAATG
jgi:hypothetical protein